MLVQRMPFDALDGVLWGLQVLVLLLVGFEARISAPPDPRSPNWERSGIAILTAWAWRLAYAFVLASIGFQYLVADDPARWALSWGWSVAPYLITWDGIWQGGTFYLHGAAMAVLQDPLAASKFVSATYNLLPLIGIFVLAQGLYRNERLSGIAVLAAAPWWIHILLGTGTMTEMPVTGFLLAGVGLLLLALDPKTEDGGSRAALIGAALCFLAATTFHLVAWMMLAAFLLAFGRSLLSTPKASVRRHLPLFLALSGAYCLVWIVGCWIKFGSPLAFLGNYGAFYAAHDFLKLSPARRAFAYPLAFLYDAWLILPALGAGLIGTWSDPEGGRRARLVVVGVALTLLILVASAMLGSPSNALPVRSVVAPVAALFPIALAPFTRTWPAGAASFRKSWRRGLTIFAVSLLGIAWVVANHERTFERVRSQQTQDPDAVAVGAWLREAFAQPDTSGRVDETRIVHVWVTGSSEFPDLSIPYLFGAAARTRRHSPTEDGASVLSSIRPGEWLVTDRPPDDTDYERVVTIGKYRVLRAKR